ncbi:Aldo/keto reductase [Annulohypoxylon truncatum]|uniref:Aldo/keto reductase n=1 Tax=Annulohypoxylon truncatum TaxID=327061 RepID=UPI002008AB35|nr:Aldo/keto reductase [Annulohypoxylon truncatum]KAI1206084.1 Aldo/keto reductase [Annulohypoxylon truncatum]
MADQAKPRIILGLMVIGPEGSPGARMTSLDDFKQALDIFQDRGYNELDTARVYIGGEQESFTRKAGWKERGLSMGTKIWPLPVGSHAPGPLKETFETSLKELGTDSVDILYLHSPDRSVPFSTTLAAINELHKAGKFSRLGLSNYTSFEVAEIVMTCQHNGWVRPTVYQAIYNCLFRTIEAELIPTCRRYGIAVDAYSPTGGGFLLGKITTKDDDPKEGRFAAGPFQHLTRGRYFRDGIIEGARLIREAAESRGLSPLELAVRWLVHHSQLQVKGGHDGIVIGFSNLQQLRDNLDYLEKGPLDKEILAVLEKAWQLSKGDMEAYWQFPMEYAYDTKEVLFGPERSQ